MATYEYIGGETPDGMIIGYGATNKVGMHGATCTQAAAVSETAVNTVATTGTATGGYGFTTSTQGDAIIATVNGLATAVKAINTILKNKGITAAS